MYFKTFLENLHDNSQNDASNDDCGDDGNNDGEESKNVRQHHPQVGHMQIIPRNQCKNNKTTQ